MTITSLGLFAAAAEAATSEGTIRTMFEWGRIQSRTDWILPVAAFVAIGVFVWAVYRRDAAELHPLLAWVLVALRTTAFMGLLIFYLQPQWRTERDVERNSRVLLLVDTSRSMGQIDTAGAGTPGVGSGAAKTRIQQVASALADTDFLRRLRAVHDVDVVRFNDDLDHDRVPLKKLADKNARGDGTEAVPSSDGAGPAEGQDLLVGNGLKANGASTDLPPDEDAPEKPPDWNEFLALAGTETRLGMALQQLLNDESGRPLAGIVVFTDGGQNAGIDPEVAIDLASKAKIPIFPVGIGSARRPINVRISDLVVPSRAYPGDSYKVTGFVQAQGVAGRQDKEIEVELSVRRSGGAAADPGAADDGTAQIVDRQKIILRGDGEVVPVEFELTPEQTGRVTLELRIRPGGEDHNADDNRREADVEIVDRKNRVLLFAGGPTREYRFVRTLLYRDRSTTVDVLLQTARPGISQDADKLLDDFPATREEMFDYDCVLAFDPDWKALGTSGTNASPIDLLEEWVAEQGGGLVVVAGPVFTGTMIGGWVESDDPDMAKVRKLYPVRFHRRFSASEEGAYATSDPWKLDFTREGLEAEYLSLEDSATAGRRAWEGFEGVYGCCLVRGPKDGATVLARFSDPRTGASGEQPVFFAGQFYGSGRVFYLGSGEMWRLRRLDETYFEQFYTKLLRHVSQGRLLRGSSRGVLLVDRDRYLLGSTVEVRTQLTDARLQPLAIPRVLLQVVRPDGAVQSVALQPSDSARAGTYAGRFPVVEEGSYRLELEIPESGGERLVRRIQVKVPDLERENPQRNDPLLGHIAQKTGGKYFHMGTEPATWNGNSLIDQLPDRTETIVMTLVPNRLWTETWRRWMILALCGLLCLEWLIRRLVKLA